MTTTVTAHAHRSGNWWAVEVPEVPGLFTQAKRLAQIPAMVRDAAELLNAGEVEVTVVPHLTDELDAELAAAKEHSAEAARLQRAASQEAREITYKIRELGLSVRDLATMLDVSPQRISQIAPTKH